MFKLPHSSVSSLCHAYAKGRPLQRFSPVCNVSWTIWATSLVTYPILCLSRKANYTVCGHRMIPSGRNYHWQGTSEYSLLCDSGPLQPLSITMHGNRGSIESSRFDWEYSRNVSSPPSQGCISPTTSLLSHHREFSPVISNFVNSLMPYFSIIFALFILLFIKFHSWLRGKM